MKINKKYLSHILIYTILSGFVFYGWFIFIQNDNTTLKKFVHRYRLSKWTPWSNNPISRSLCNNQSSKKGFHQKIISFSLYAKNNVINERFFQFLNGVKKNHELINTFYPVWLMRIYTNNISMFKILPGLSSYIDANQKDLLICDINTVNSFLGNLTSLFGMMWRFLPMFDPTVDIFISRDLDSNIGEREVSAVKQWEESTSIFHAMRDHPYHGVSILGGMWGGKNYLMDNNITSSLKNSFIKINRSKHYRGFDQDFLGSDLYKPFKNHFMEHDSYFCQSFKNSIPFPTKRHNPTLFVGGYNYEETNETNECPIACRPKYGKSWKYC